VNSLDYLAKIMNCPSTGKPLEAKAGALHTLKQNIVYPSYMGIPWVYKNPHRHVLEWRYRIKAVIDHYKNQSQKAEGELRKLDLLESTLRRLELLKNSYQVSANSFETLLAPFMTDDQKQPSIENLYFEKVPRQQTLTSYYQTVFRDWAWGQNEIAQQGAQILPHLKNCENLLILGGGACALPLFLHENLSTKNTVVVDINPLLFFTAKKIIEGEPLQLIEYPKVPTSTKDIAVTHNLKSKTQLHKIDNFHMLFADALDLTFKPETFDAILTPWFIDIVPRNFRDLAKYMNQFLTKGGRWVNIGQLGFERNALNEIMSADEIIESLIEAGFNVETSGFHELPYLNSPHDAVVRRDKLFTFTAIKEKPTKTPKRYEYLPDWLTQLDKPIPMTPEIELFKIKTIIFNQASSYIDGQKSFNQTKMNLVQAKESLYNFYVNLYEQLIFREF
jgi:N2227-like protein